MQILTKLFINFNIEFNKNYKRYKHGKPAKFTNQFEQLLDFFVSLNA